MVRTEFAGVMAYLSSAVGKPIAPDQAEVYFDLLGDLPLPTLQFAAKRAVLESAYPTLPPAGTLRRLAVEAMHASESLPTPIEAWELCRNAIVQFGYYREEQGLASLPQCVRRAAECLGWKEICDSTEPEIVRAQFQRAYETLGERTRRTALLPAPVMQMLATLTNSFDLPKVSEPNRIIRTNSLNGALMTRKESHDPRPG